MMSKDQKKKGELLNRVVTTARDHALKAEEIPTDQKERIPGKIEPITRMTIWR